MQRGLQFVLIAFLWSCQAGDSDAPGDAANAQARVATAATRRGAPVPSEEQICRAAIAAEPASSGTKSLWYACPRSFISPNGRWELFTLRSDGDDGIRVRLKDLRSRTNTEPMRVVELTFPASLAWSPASDGFLVNDSEGSGQSSYLRYFHIQDGRVVESRALHRAATDLYKRLFECTSPETYLYVSGEGWHEQLRLIHLRVWSSHHSQGCPLDPIAGNELHLLGDPTTGRIYRDYRRAPLATARE